MTWNGPLNKIDDYRYEIPTSYKGVNDNLKMKTSALIYASDEMISHLKQDNAPEQAANMTMLPGIVGKAMAMPDIHWGYGFPIGGVAATDAEQGVISPGGVGFDINCLHGDAMVLHEHGYRMKIKDFERNWNNNRIKCANFGKKIKNTDINAFMKFETKKKIYEVFTESGEKIIATEDHPFYTPNGMVPCKDIKNPGMIAIYPFEGVDYSQPSETLIISKEDILNLPIEKNLNQTLQQLKNKDLIPLKCNNEKLPYLLKLMGYIFGNGCLHFTKNKGTIWLYGEPEDLEELREDIKRIGFTSSRIKKREGNHKIKTMHDPVQFQRADHSIKISSSCLAALLWAIGTPCGNKRNQAYTLPSWIFKLASWQKRLYLSSFFGAVLSSPSTISKQDFNFYPRIISMNKLEQYLESGNQFLKDIQTLLEAFDVSSKIINKKKEYIDKKGIVSYTLRLQISSKIENLLTLWKRIGFEYNKKRRHLANSAICYLNFKKRIVTQRKNADEKAKFLKRNGVPSSKIFTQLQSTYVNKRFIERSLYEKRKNPPRVAFNFPKFKEFHELKTKGLGNSGILWDKITKKRIVKTDGTVYDFSVADPHHNFIANNFVVSNCGVRLVRTNLTEEDLNKDTIRQLVDTMFKNVPSGLGSKAKVRLNKSELSEMLTMGVRWPVEQGYGWDEDPTMLEEEGCLEEADLSQVSSKAMQRGIPQVGSLGAGNHFLEIQKVADIYDGQVAKKFGITKKGQITVMIHTGSRGFGHQICSDHLRIIEKAVKKYNIWLPDRQLACAPVTSKEGENYLKAMACAANFAWCNRQMIVHWVRESFEQVLNQSSEDLGMHIVYDVCHNIAKREEHVVDGKKRKVIVHRKGATRAFGPNRSEIPSRYQDVGQPVLIPGDMGTESYVLHGIDASEETFGSTCHGAGRVMSRNSSRKKFWGQDVVKELGRRGVYVHPASFKVAAEEAPGSYKNIRDVVDAVDGAGISKKVVRLQPVGVVKG